MRRKVILTDDDDDVPGAIDLVSRSGVVAGDVSAPEVAGLELRHHCACPGPYARARANGGEACRFISPLSVDVRSECVPPAVAAVVHDTQDFTLSRAAPLTHPECPTPVPRLVRIPDVIVIDDDDAQPLPAAGDPAASAAPLNIFQYAARFGRFPSVPAPSRPQTAAVPSLPASSTSSLPAAVAGSRTLSDLPSVFEDREALHGDSTSSGSSGSSGSELSGDFVVHEEPAMRRKDRKVLEMFFPLTAKRLRMARVAPNLEASRPHRKQRVSQGSSQEYWEAAD
jgi:hypothetical protein